MPGDLKQYEQLSAYLDGELSDSQRAEVDRLLQRDPEARAILEELRRTAAAIHSLPKEMMPRHASDAINARLERESLLGADTSPSSQRGWRLPFAIAASLAIVCTVGYLSMARLQEYRERRVFALADNEYRRPASDMPARHESAAPPMSIAAQQEERKDNLSKSEPKEETLALQQLGRAFGRMQTKDTGTTASSATPVARKIDASADAATISNDLDERVTVADRPISAPAESAPSANSRSSLPLAFRAGAASKPATSQPAATQPAATSRPTSQGADRE